VDARAEEEQARNGRRDKSLNGGICPRTYFYRPW
jgi:hypothetical protein